MKDLVRGKKNFLARGEQEVGSNIAWDWPEVKMLRIHLVIV